MFAGGREEKVEVARWLSGREGDAGNKRDAGLTFKREGAKTSSLDYRGMGRFYPGRDAVSLGQHKRGAEEGRRGHVTETHDSERTGAGIKARAGGLVSLAGQQLGWWDATLVLLAELGEGIGACDWAGRHARLLARGEKLLLLGRCAQVPRCLGATGGCGPGRRGREVWHFLWRSMPMGSSQKS